MQRHILNSAVIAVLYLLLAIGTAQAESHFQKSFTLPEKEKIQPAVPKQLLRKKDNPFIEKKGGNLIIISPEKAGANAPQEDTEEGGAEPEELYEEYEYYIEEPSPTRSFPGGGGSFLGRDLPPPPPVPPVVTEKDPDIIEPGEVVIISADMEKAKGVAQQSANMGFSIKRRRMLKGLGLVISVLRLPAGMIVGDALKKLRENIPELWTDANHRYQLLSGEGDNVKRYGHELIGWKKATENCGAGLRIGLIDTLVDTNHLALKGQRIVSRSFLTQGVKRAPMDHGTAVASLLIGNSPQGLLPGAELYVAGIFRQRGKRNIDTTAELVALALDWLASQKTAVINLSLGGPRNLIIEAAIKRLEALDVALTAAAGNGGPKALPIYPAAHEEVIAATAVDARLKSYRLANQGYYIDFAAPGVDIWAAKPGEGGSYVSGTSFAVPFVTATIGMTRIANPEISWLDLRKKIEKEARDLGKSGRDSVFGWGLVQAHVSCED